jgi:hypothetical protein
MSENRYCAGSAKKTSFGLSGRSSPSNARVEYENADPRTTIYQPSTQQTQDLINRVRNRETINPLPSELRFAHKVNVPNREAAVLAQVEFGTRDTHQLTTLL